MEGASQEIGDELPVTGRSKLRVTANSWGQLDKEMCKPDKG